MPVKAYMLFFWRDLEAFVLYYVMGVSVPSIHRESTDSLIHNNDYCVYTHASVYSTATLNTHYNNAKEYEYEGTHAESTVIVTPPSVRGARALHGWWRVLHSIYLWRE